MPAFGAVRHRAEMAESRLPSNRQPAGVAALNGEVKDAFLGLKLISISRMEALCFVSTPDKPFLLSKVAGIFTIHDCDILEADIQIRDGIATDLYKIRIRPKYSPGALEQMLYEALHRVLKGDTNIEKEIFEWEKKREIIRDQIVPTFKSVRGNRFVLAVRTSNKRGLLHKIAWALSLAGMNIEKAIISATEDMKGEDVFWARQRYGEAITAKLQEKVLGLLRIVVHEGHDPLEQAFKKEINMIYRQQLRRRGSGFRTAQLYANLHLRLIEGLFERIKRQLDIEDHPILIGVYGGIGSGAIGFTSDVDCIFLYEGPERAEYEKLKGIFQSEWRRICDLDIDESFLTHHINYFYLSRYEGDRIVCFDDFFAYVHYIDRLRTEADDRLSEPQFFHYPWAFSMRLIGAPQILAYFERRVAHHFPKPHRKGYRSIKAYILGEQRQAIKGNYLAYLKGRYFPDELQFCDTKRLKRLLRQRAYQEFIDAMRPYDAVKFLFRRGVFPLLHIIHYGRQRTDMGLLGREYRHIRPALDFMLKTFNVRKTLFIMGRWDVDYFLYIMDVPNVRQFCQTYVRYQEQIVGFVKDLIRTHDAAGA